MNIKIRLNGLWIATLGGFIVTLQIGITIGWPSPNISKLTGKDSNIPLTPDEASWVAALFPISAVIGSVAGSLLVHFYGSRKTMLCATFVSGLAWVCLIAANALEWLYAARFFNGMNAGLCYSSYAVYLADVSSANIRGTIIAIASGGIPIGTLMTIIAESYLPMKLSSLIYLIQCLVGIIIFVRLMDSPYYLVKINKLESTRKSIAFYFNNVDVDKKLQEIKTFVEANSSQKLRYKIKELNTPKIRKSLFLITLLFMFPQLSGMLSIMSYMEVIIIKAKMHAIDSQQFVIYMNIASILSMLLTIRVIDRCGRRISFIISSVGTSVSLICLGMHFFLLDLKFDAQKLQWLPIISIFMYVIAYSVAYTSVPSAVLSEIFPENIKNGAVLLACLTSSFAGFLISKTYQPMIDSIKEAYTFWIYAGMSLMATPCAIFLMPKSEGKTFQEIQNLLVNQ